VNFLVKLMASVLVVDDEDLIRWSLAQSLEAAGYDVVEAGSAGETLQRLTETSDICVVLLDLKLPDSSDLTLLRTLRQRAPGCRIILMTAHGTTETLDEALEAGAFRALGKPFDMGKMVGIVQEAIAA
jgi:DNA-binding NtrC family response regulator